MPPNDEHSRNMIISHLEQVNYWHGRFELSRDIDHLDNAERFAEAIKTYLPKGFQSLSIIGLCNLYLNLASLSQSDRSGE